MINHMFIPISQTRKLKINWILIVIDNLYFVRFYIAMIEEKWVEIGNISELQKEFENKSLKEIVVGTKRIALSYQNGEFGAISGVCNHVGGPLGKGTLQGEYITCPWHYWKFHRKTGEGEPGFESDRVPPYRTKVENEKLYINMEPLQKRHREPHPAHSLSRKVERAPGPIRILGISTTAMTSDHPRFSTSEELLKYGLSEVSKLGVETKLIRLNDLNFKNCEGFYSKSAYACTWPCSITQMDEKDQMEKIYEGMVHWADIVFLATPIRWGSASSLYFKMVERLNCIQNQITLNNKVLIQKKVASFIITGGQDNIQAVAGELLGFFAEIGYVFPPFPYIAHSLGWTAENMEKNMGYVAESTELRAGTVGLLHRAIELSKVLIQSENICEAKLDRGGRKARRLEISAIEKATNQVHDSKNSE